MHMINLSKKIFIIGFLISQVLLFNSCKSSNSNRITKVYTPEGKQGTILFDTESKTGQVLIKDSSSVFFVMQTSLSQEWAVVSKMPSDPDEANGSNEEKLLFYVPQKRIVYNPHYGSKAYLISIETQGTNEQVQWLINDLTDSVSINDLQKLCLGDPNACSEKSESNNSVTSDEIKIADTNSLISSQAADSFALGGWLKTGLDQNVILEHLGEPEEKGEDQYWDATGTYVQEWSYSSQGLKLNMESDSINALKTVRSIIIVSPSKLTTPESVGIGTDFEKVKSIYSAQIDSESSNENMLVIGSLYGGMVITFEENKVEQIFIGAGAE
jgi:hypothetical protein